MNFLNVFACLLAFHIMISYTYHTNFHFSKFCYVSLCHIDDFFFINKIHLLGMFSLKTSLTALFRNFCACLFGQNYTTQKKAWGSIHVCQDPQTKLYLNCFLIVASLSASRVESFCFVCYAWIKHDVCCFFPTF